MRAVRADRKLELEQEFVGCIDFGVARTPILTANLAELTRPVRQAQGLARIERGRIGTIRAVVSLAGGLPARVTTAPIARIRRCATPATR
jgi:hypothetical protein